MQIQVHTDHTIEANEKLAEHVRDVLDGTLSRFSDRMTRVEVHLSDQNSEKGGEDKRCRIIGRLEGREPVVATHQAGTVDQAVHGAADKLKRVLNHTVDRLQHHH